MLQANAREIELRLLILAETVNDKLLPCSSFRYLAYKMLNCRNKRQFPLPGILHITLLHSWDWELLPLQSLPPLHMRERVRWPPLQVFEQALQPPHEVQTPEAENKERKRRSHCMTLQKQ